MNSLKSWGRIERNQVASLIGHGNAIRPMFLSALERMMRAALGASIKKGIGHVFLSVMRERTKPGQMAETWMPSLLSMPRSANAHVFMHAFVAL